MKKITLLALVLALLLAMTLPASAISYGGYLGMVPEATEDIAVDGEKDDAYASALEVEVSHQLFNFGTAPDATAKAYLLFKDTDLYIYAEVDDADVITPKAEFQTMENAWYNDALEVILDTNNAGADEDLLQYRIDCAGFLTTQDRYGENISAAGADAEEYFTGASKEIEGGYAVELKIPVTTTEIGICLVLNDVNSEQTTPENANDITFAQCYSELTGMGPGAWIAQQYPYITLGYEKPAETQPAETKPSEDTTLESTLVTEAPEETEAKETEAKETEAKETQAKETEAKETEAKPQEAKGGCGGAVSAAGILALALVPTALLKKKEN